MPDDDRTTEERLAALEAEREAGPPRSLSEAQHRVHRGLEAAIEGDHERLVAIRRRRRGQEGGDDD